MARFTEEQVTTQVRKLLETITPHDSIDLVSGETMELLEATVIKIAHQGVAEMECMRTDPIEAGRAILLSVATLAFGLGVDCGIELQATKAFAEQFGGPS
jgi:hypothetical protein